MSVVTEYVILNRAGLPGNPPSHPWEPSESSLFSFCLFIYLFKLSTGFREQGVPAFWVILLPEGEEEDKLCKKMDFIHCGKVSVFGGKKCVPHSLHMMNLRFMWR